jgi:hypothetical protein
LQAGCRKFDPCQVHQFLNSKVHTNFYNKVSILDYEFLSQVECSVLLNKINSLESKWQTSVHHPYLNFLPLPLYSFQDDSYVANATSYNLLMYDTFQDVYEKLKHKLSEKLSMELTYHGKLSYPGFHISNENPMVDPNFHTDIFYQLGNIFTGREKFYFNNGKILSVVVPLSVISDSDGLIYRTVKLNKDKRQKLIYDNFLPYKEGMLAIWDGAVQHSMNPFPKHTCKNRRITLQCHIAIANKGYIFW